VLIALGVTVAVSGVGAIGAFVVAIVAAVLARKQGSFRGLGFRAPTSWPKLLGLTFLYGLILQTLLLVLIEPVLAHWTSTPVDLSKFDAVRGNMGIFWCCWQSAGWQVTFWRNWHFAAL